MSEEKKLKRKRREITMGKINNRIGYPLKLLKFKLYVKCFLTGIIWGYIFKKIGPGNDRCKCCKKILPKERRIELSIVSPVFNYESIFDEFLCRECALVILYNLEEI